MNCDCSNDHDCTDWIDTGRQCFQIQKERFHLHYLGSLEVAKSKGNEVLEQCIHKIIETHLKQSISKTTIEHQFTSFPCLFEIDNFGVKFTRKDDQLNESIEKENSCLDDELSTNRLDDQSNHSNKTDLTIIDDIKCEQIDDYIKIELNNQNRNSTDQYFETDSKLIKTDEQASIKSSNEKSTSSFKLKKPTSMDLWPIRSNDYFFHLKNITFCGSPTLKDVISSDSVQEYYFAFISKHPKIKHKFASHIFKCHTEQVAKMICESIGRAFHRFYQNYIVLSQNLIEPTIDH